MDGKTMKRMIIWGMCVFALLGLSNLGCETPGNDYGKFPTGMPLLRPVEQGEIMLVMEDYVFIDGHGNSWKTPKGEPVDGQSIPRVLWSIVGHPFHGRCLPASVIHDYYCNEDVKYEYKWKDVHRIFYYGCLANNATKTEALLKYWGVIIGGPKWGENTSNCQSKCHSMQKDYVSEHDLLLAGLEKMKEDGLLKSESDKIKSSDLNLEELEKLAASFRKEVIAKGVALAHGASQDSQ